jgi:hypothetical protein
MVCTKSKGLTSFEIVSRQDMFFRKLAKEKAELTRRNFDVGRPSFEEQSAVRLFGVPLAMFVKEIQLLWVPYPRAFR